MTIEIKTRQMPTRTVNPAFGKRVSKYPLADLKAGTEECLVLEGIDNKKDHSKLSSAVANFKKSGGTGKFSIRSFTEDGVTKVGLWKVAD